MHNQLSQLAQPIQTWTEPESAYSGRNKSRKEDRLQSRIKHDVQVQRANQQKHFGIILDDKLNFKCHIDKFLTKTSKSIAVIKRLRNVLPRKSLITIYKAIIRPHLDYGDILYDQPNNATFCQKIESVQYKAALAITSAIQGTSQEKFYDELGLETLKSQGRLRRLCCMYKIVNIGIPKYLTDLIP